MPEAELLESVARGDLYVASGFAEGRKQDPRMIGMNWRACPEIVPFPGQDEVHVWRAQPSQHSERRWEGILTDDEQERASRYHFAADRCRFAVTRGILRTMLGQYIAMAPASLRFECNPFGKPTLAGEQNPGGLHFNVAHSGDCSLLAFGLAEHLGVDVEHLRAERNIAGLARTVLSRSQYQSFLVLPEAEGRKTFFEAWTRKEAIVKALGGGLSIPLDSLAVARAGAPEWFVRSLEMDGPYAATVAVKAPSIALRLWSWPPESA